MTSIVLTGGGTAGHVTACLALVPRLKRQFDEIHYIGSVDGIEKKLVAADPDIVWHEIECTKLKRSLSPSNLAIPYRLAKSVNQAKKLLKEINPSVVFGKGGYVTLPVALACGKRFPLVLHESDLSLGLANRIAAKRAKTVCTTFASVLPYVHTGTPIRPELYQGKAETVRIRHGIRMPILLVTGGSQGAAALNDAVRKNLSALTEKFFVIHLTGKGKTDEAARDPRYVQLEYVENPADYFAAADVVLTRGGSNTLHELAALRKPMIIVPLPKGGASRGDQEENAAYFEHRKLARVLPQSDLSRNALLRAVLETFAARTEYRERLSDYPADGTEAVFREIVKASQEALHG